MRVIKDKRTGEDILEKVDINTLKLSLLEYGESIGKMGSFYLMGAVDSKKLSIAINEGLDLSCLRSWIEEAKENAYLCIEWRRLAIDKNGNNIGVEEFCSRTIIHNKNNLRIEDSDNILDEDKNGGVVFLGEFGWLDNIEIKAPCEKIEDGEILYSPDINDGIDDLYKYLRLAILKLSDYREARDSDQVLFFIGQFKI